MKEPLDYFSGSFVCEQHSSAFAGECDLSLPAVLGNRNDYNFIICYPKRAIESKVEHQPLFDIYLGIKLVFDLGQNTE